MTVKLMMFGRRAPGQTIAENRLHMKDVHGRLVLDYIAADPQSGPRRYTQNHGLDGVFADDEAAPLALRLGLDFVTQIWFEDLTSLKASRETPFYHEQLRPDESRFVDVANVIGQPFSEEFTREPAPGPADIKLFVVRPRGADAINLFDSLASGEVAFSGYCRNLAVTPGPIGVVDEVWARDEDEARLLLDHCRQALDAEATDGKHSAAYLIAREYRLFAGR
ncbi:EthD domain-containing protein [Allorhizobium pseudoryzae]|uniref:EthD domain-containing protein n=1 Tax=Allorhizobium pseudoryzae TaxID=379684 RepID=UPI003D066612